MKKLKFLSLLVIVLVISFLVYFIITKILSSTKVISDVISNTEKKSITTYINDIYNQNTGIPEFEDINEANEIWLWDNINQYLCNHSEFEERTNKYCDYTYEEISSFAKTLYGENLSKSCPTGNEVMIFDEETNKYGVPTYSVEAFKQCQIESIQKHNNIYTVNIIDYTISFYDTLGNNPSNHINFHNINEFTLNPMSADTIFYVMELKDYKDKVLENKNKFTSKTLIIEYDETNKNYHIKTCKYNYSDEDIIKDTYNQILESFNLYNLEYNPNEFNTYSKAEVKNFDELSSIYTENGINIYKDTFDILSFENDKVFIKSENLSFLDYLYSTEISDITSSENEISCTITSTLLKSPYETEYPPTEKDLSDEPFTATFKILKVDNKWKIDEFNFWK